jgi:hypothetical protein
LLQRNDSKQKAAAYPGGFFVASELRQTESADQGKQVGACGTTARSEGFPCKTQLADGLIVGVFAGSDG